MISIARTLGVWGSGCRMLLDFCFIYSSSSMISKSYSVSVFVLFGSILLGSVLLCAGVLLFVCCEAFQFNFYSLYLLLSSYFFSSTVLFRIPTHDRISSFFLLLFSLEVFG
ncbi:hypothetical protein BZA05DRAFT_225942 [Tricharina praecox]|uniref:uncharacterized protein n=1 Tax=Tricharina praecox TaxID=43433 RepID=UPI0022209A0B|nr:uncharacterized protein BZA05DRAFT_225942 [Tricharina praecox]KAI5856075.1 hypothetical protein BZA05DRAFT_225942 [Tricharina praecox]